MGTQNHKHNVELVSMGISSKYSTYFYLNKMAPFSETELDWHVNWKMLKKLFPLLGFECPHHSTYIPTFIEWQSNICRSPTFSKCYGKKAKTTINLTPKSHQNVLLKESYPIQIPTHVNQPTRYRSLTRSSLISVLSLWYPVGPFEV